MPHLAEHDFKTTLQTAFNEDDDFATNLLGGFDMLRSMLLGLHLSELNALRDDNQQLTAELAMFKHGIVPDIEVKSNDAEKQTHSAPLSPTQAKRLSQISQGLTPEIVDEGRASSAASANEHSPADEHSQVPSLLRSRTSSVLHFHMKKMWMTLVEAGLQEVSLASFDELRAPNTDVDASEAHSTDVLHRSQTKYRLSVGSAKFSCLDRFVINPHSSKRLLWTFISLLLLAFDFFMVPFSVCFEIDDDAFERALLAISCIFWTLDIFATAFTGFYLDFHLVMDRLLLFEMYAKSWLVFDVTLVILDCLVLVLQSVGEATVLSVFRSVRVVRVMRMLRLMRVARKAKLRNLINDLFVVTPDVLHGIFMSFSTGLFTLAFLHIGACIWAVVGRADDGWMFATKLNLEPAFNQYVVSLHWTLTSLQGSRPSLLVLRYPLEISIDNCIVLAGYALSSVFVATITLTVLTNAESDTAKIHRMAKRYLKAHDCTSATKHKTHRFLRSHTLDGPAELLAYEAQLFRALPLRLQEDLHYESRAPKLCRLSCFGTLYQLSGRCVWQLCHEMYDKMASEDEAVFSKGDACNHMYMIRDGKFKYKCEEEVLEITPRQASFPRLQEGTSSPGCDILGKGQFLCEAALWTDWENAGDCCSMDQFGLLLIFDSDKFANVIMQYRVGRCLAAKYSHHFVWRLNRSPSCDVTGFDLPMSELDTPAYAGTPENHFAFISHYKMESGTEAILMRDLMLTFVRSDPTHEANEFMSAIFVDSEDLIDLARIEAHVAGSNNIILLLTPGFLSRPWCLLEFVTAVRNNVTIVPVEIQRPGLRYIYPDEEWFSSLRRGHAIPADAIALLLGMGVTLDELENAIRQVFMKIALPFSPHKSGAVRCAEIADIMRRCSDVHYSSQSYASMMSWARTGKSVLSTQSVRHSSGTSIHSQASAGPSGHPSPGPSGNLQISPAQYTLQVCQAELDQVNRISM